MGKVYARLIIKGTKTFDDVPESLVEDVKAALIELGYPDLIPKDDVVEEEKEEATDV